MKVLYGARFVCVDCIRGLTDRAQEEKERFAICAEFLGNAPPMENRKAGQEKLGGDKKSDTEEIVSETDEEKKEEMEAKLSQTNLTMGELRVRNFAYRETSGEFSKRSRDYDSLHPS